MVDRLTPTTAESEMINRLVSCSFTKFHQFKILLLKVDKTNFMKTKRNNQAFTVCECPPHEGNSKSTIY